jgi:hypothetical protein
MNFKDLKEETIAFANQTFAETCMPHRSEIKLDNFSIQQRDDEQK